MQGEFRDGLLYNGTGSSVFKNGDVHSGTWVNGLLQGYAEILFAGGNRSLRGMFHEGAFVSGSGTIVFKNGGMFTGEWSEGRWNGPGTLVFPTGDTRVGNFVDGLLEGAGQQVYVDGAVCEGQYVLSKRVGVHTTTLPDGSVLRGTYEDDKLVNGTGVINFGNGRLYTGEVRNGLQHGKGRLVDKDKVCEGSWGKSRQHGYGRVTYSDGLTYQGKFIAGKLYHGQGTMRVDANTMYEGYWVDGLQQGAGKLTVDGTVVEGVWQKGVLQPAGTVFSDTASVAAAVEAHSKLTYANGLVLQGVWTEGRPPAVSHVEVTASISDTNGAITSTGTAAAGSTPGRTQRAERRAAWQAIQLEEPAKRQSIAQAVAAVQQTATSVTTADSGSQRHVDGDGSDGRSALHGSEDHHLQHSAHSSQAPQASELPLRSQLPHTVEECGAAPEPTESPVHPHTVQQCVEDPAEVTEEHLTSELSAAEDHDVDMHMLDTATQETYTQDTQDLRRSAYPKAPQLRLSAARDKDDGHRVIDTATQKTQDTQDFRNVASPNAPKLVDGKYVYANGDTYEGELLRGKKHGFGRYVYADGSVYVGTFERDKQKGKGILKMGNFGERDWELFEQDCLDLDAAFAEFENATNHI